MLVFGCCKVYKSPGAVRTTINVNNPAGRPSPPCPEAYLAILNPHLMNLRSKSRHLQLKGHQQAGREHSRMHINLSNGLGAVRFGLRGLKMP